MRKVFSRISCLAALLLGVGLFAQNNPYEIDDECFQHFTQAELLLGKEGFEKENAALLKSAIQAGDTKAQTLYYVERLKNTTAVLRQVHTTTQEQDEDVLQKMEDLQRVSRELGYIQYYYYAFDLAQSHFYNHDKALKTMELIQQMREVARKNHEPYGIWMGNRYLIQLYVAQNDYISAKKYIVEALDMYNTTTDPTILRQSATRLYCDLANTYPIGHDSVRINVAKAEQACKQHLDTLRVRYHQAKLAAYDKDLDAYAEYRDYCVADPSLANVSPSARQMFQDIDLLVYGDPETDSPDINISGMTDHLREIKYIANIAENYGFKDLAFGIEKQLVVYNETVLSSANQSKLAEVDAMLGNDVLHAQVDYATLRAEKAQRGVFLLVILIMAGILVFFYIYNRNLRKTNEKVRLADAAKTRFVQNMSHEVRTPLNAIVGFSQLLSLPDGSFPEEEKEEFAGYIVNNTKMLTMLLDDILNASAMDEGNYKITYEEGEVHFMAQAAISSAEHRLQPGVRLYYAPEREEPFTFTTDPRRVQQILINLITNACKHTSSGEIKVASSLTDKEGYVSYSVTDTGPGVPPEQAEKIFERFTKLNNFVQGTGLGLSICRDIAKMMGANVYLDTTFAGGGARFVFEVPVTPPSRE